MINVPTKKNLRALGRYFWWLHFTWWHVTQLFTWCRAPADMDLLSQIPRYVYSKDKPFDFMRHPHRIARRILNGAGPGDCDDFAVWRASWLLRRGHREVFVLLVVMQKNKHLVTVWWDDDQDQWVWADYGAATGARFSVDPPALQIGAQVAASRGRGRDTLVGVAIALCTLTRRGSVRFGRVKAGAM